MVALLDVDFFDLGHDAGDIAKVDHAVLLPGHKAHVDFFIIGRDQLGLESLGYNGVGIENRLNKVIAREFTSGRTEVGTFLFRLLVDGVAGNTTLAKIEGLAIGDVPFLSHG